jgi:NADPH:quinone reductase-like Zn-dependent oxidoreductase
LLNASITAKKPAEVSFADAATLPVAAATAYDGVRQLELRSGEVLLIVGAGGGVGIAAAQIAVAAGVVVIGTASAAKADLVSSVGAIHVEYGPSVSDRIKAVAPMGVDAIFDLVGGDALYEVGALVPSGDRIVTAASPASAYAAALDLGGSRVARSLNSATLAAVAALTATGTLNPFVTAMFPLEEVGAALALVESGHASGKVVIEVS